jgi:very-short-patch-repair endonuclease
VVSLDQLRELGFSEEQVKHARASRLIHPVLRGTYAIGHPGISRWGAMQAAILSCGPGAVISHGSAAALLGLSERLPVLTDVISPGERGRGIQGVRWHRVPVPGADEMTTRHGLPCTIVARTLVDLAGARGERSMRSLVEEAAVQRSLDVSAVEAILSRGRRRGAPRLRALLASWRITDDDPPTLRSRLEARLWPHLVEHGLSLPRTNATLDLDGVRREVDFLWSDELLVVETDGAATHRTAHAFGRDRWRDQLLVAAGYRVIRVTWDQLANEPEAVLARIRRALEPA